MDLKLKSNKIVTIKEQVYNVIKENILNGNLKPGERLQEVKIAKGLNVSRSPVREALKELLGEGLLENIPNKSISVKQLSCSDIQDIYDFRKIIELYSIEMAIAKLSDEKIQILNEIKENLIINYKSKNLKEYCDVDAKLHHQIIKMSENNIVSNAVENIFTLIKPFRIIALHGKKRFEESLDEHVQIIEGIKNKDIKKATNANSLHLELAKNSVLAHLVNEEKNNL